MKNTIATMVLGDKIDIQNQLGIDSDSGSFLLQVLVIQYEDGGDIELHDRLVTGHYHLRLPAYCHVKQDTKI